MKTIKENWIYGLFIFAVVLFLVTRFTNKPKNRDLVKLSSKTYKTEGGWGYDIYANDSVYIHQEFIPAVEGRKGFATQTDADKVAQLALYRMQKQKQKLPVILLADLDSLKIAR